MVDEPEDLGPAPRCWRCELCPGLCDECAARLAEEDDEEDWPDEDWDEPQGWEDMT